MAGSSPALKGKKLLVFDDGLASKDGHWFEIDRAIVEIHSQSGAVVTLACHSCFVSGGELEAAGARVCPVIEQSVWNGWTYAGKGIVGEFAGLLEQARHFRGILEAFLREGPVDLVLHPSASPADVLAWCLIPRKLRRRAGRVRFLTRFGLGSYSAVGAPQFARKLVYWRWMIRWLGQEFAIGRFALLTDSGRLADEYAAVTGVRPHVLCSPQAMDPIAAKVSPSSVLTFGALGWARAQKGSDIIQAAVERLIVENALGDLRIVLQWNRTVFMADGSALRRSPVLLAQPQVEFIEEVLSSAQYRQAMLAIDCMVLPYRRALYHSQTSGVAVEAACAGIPMIYTADTWLSDFVGEQGAGIAVADGDAEGLAQAIRSMAADYPAYKAQAVERSVLARARNSPEAFAQALWTSGPNARDLRVTHG